MDRELRLKTPEEVLEATASVLLAIGTLASGDEELQDSVSATIAYVLALRDMLMEHPDFADAMMTAFVEAYRRRIIDKIEGLEPQGEA